VNQQVDLAVVGAGPAGLEAALIAAEAGATVTLIDSYPRPGGQYFKQLPASFTGNAAGLPQSEGVALLQRLAAANIQLLADTVVWGAFPAPDHPGGWLLTLYGPAAPSRLQARALILATGTYDRPVALPGWTLPGVMTTGAAQTLLKHQRLLPGRRILLSGSGPLQLAVAAQLVGAGAEVVAVLEGISVSLWQGIQSLPALWGQWARLREGWTYWRILRRAGVPLRTGWSVVEIRGKAEVEEAVIARLDDNWRPVAGSEQSIRVDTLLLEYGFTPATQLSRLLGCGHDFRPAWGGWVPRRDDNLQTTCSGVYAVGDGAGVGGAALARVEGRIAGLAAARQVGRLTEPAAEAALARLQPALTRERRFAAMLGELFMPGPGLYQLASDETIICRCEEVRLAEIRAAVQSGARTVNEVKGLTRSGMGNCQGRICGELVARAIADEAGLPGSDSERIEAAGVFTVRPPVYPLPLAALAATADLT
jgi:NADPH-dependent 2,4-dienoyl-CoA reductase/sulfur reductase-like enzyme